MKKAEIEAYEDAMIIAPLEDVESVIKRLRGKISRISESNENLRLDPRKVLCDMKEKQLQEALDAYGKVELAEIDMERIPLVFARLQADEAAARNDLANLRLHGQTEKDLKKQLEIANRILAKKLQPGGRNSD